MQGLFQKIKETFEQKGKKPNKNILVFTFFLLLSTIFWFLNALNKKYVDTIRFPVRYENYPSGKIQVGQLPENLYINLEGFGYLILRYKINSKINPVNLNVSSFILRHYSRSDSNKYYVLTRDVINAVSGQLSPEIRILDIYPDTLSFNFDEIVSKKLPVIPNLEVQCKKQFMQVGKPVLKPDSIIVSGPTAAFDTLHSIHTKYEILENVNQPIDKNISLEKHDGMAFSTKKINVFIDVEKYTEATLEIPIYTKNVPDSLRLITFPKKIAITYFVPLSLYEQVDVQDFLATIDYQSIGEIIIDKLKVRLEKHPDIIIIQGFRPKNVEYLIEKND